MTKDTDTIDIRVSAKSEQVSCELDGEAVILNFDDGVYYGLNAVGARVWQVIQSPRRISEIVEILSSEYDVAQEDCLRDVLSLVEQLKLWGLVSVDVQE